MRGLPVKPASNSTSAHGLVSDLDADLFRIGGNPAPADGGKNPSPVWICARPCRLYQKRMCNGPRNLQRFEPILCLLDPEPHHMRHALSVGNDLFSKPAADFEQCSIEFFADRFIANPARA
jgi:hypothetical protein